MEQPEDGQEALAAVRAWGSAALQRELGASEAQAEHLLERLLGAVEAEAQATRNLYAERLSAMQRALAELLAGAARWPGLTAAPVLTAWCGSGAGAGCESESKGG